MKKLLGEYETVPEKYCIKIVCFVGIILKGISIELDRREFKREYEEKRRLRAEFERKQIEKGLVKFDNVLGEERWGTPEQVRQWRIVDIES